MKNNFAVETEKERILRELKYCEELRNGLDWDYNINREEESELED